ncbi:hypothetical protein [Acinetobacter sp. ANC 5600]|uniref:hypothetical protein n=1 Tax=Acinetobacter sp. ANC 5600 TaxID=1960940 RepID=UPI0009943800|nr:hypothetical protein [Acinetobacter sp. ANC 5600]OOV81390.1 hypothetical protein B1201_09955 [Acinetobacter sp. ANC 5600]
MNTPSKIASLAMLQALANYLDQGSSNATLIFYDDAKPPTVNENADNSARLLTVNLPKPCLKSVNENNIELFAPNTGIATKTGTATWARFFNGEGLAVFDVTVGTDIVLDNADLVIGSSVKFDVIYLVPQI